MGMIITHGMPAATITNMAAGNPVVGPGFPTALEDGLPVTCMGDAVAGATCIGAISVSPDVNIIYGGRPRNCTASMAVGSNPAALGAPISAPLVGLG